MSDSLILNAPLRKSCYLDACLTTGLLVDLLTLDESYDTSDLLVEESITIRDIQIVI